MWVRKEPSPQKALMLAQDEAHSEKRRAVWIHDLRGVLYQGLRRNDEAQQEFMKAIEADPSKENPHLLMEHSLNPNKSSTKRRVNSKLPSV